MDGVHGSTTSANSHLNSNGPPPFLSKTYDMVDDPSTNSVVSWSPNNNSFVVWNHPEFARDLLPKYFKHSNFSSFVRQLNTYGFRKVDPDRWEFANEGFLRGQKHLLKTINRRKSTGMHGHQLQQPHGQSTSVGACVEVGKFGLEEEIERLKRDKNVLMQELVRLRQQQQSTDHQLQTLGQRLQGMEQRQQQMMSFLAKAMQSPGFLAQLVQQQNESNRRIVGVNKKRRLPKHEDISEKEHASAPDGQIVKYQPLMNQAAKAMLRQILKIDTPPRLETGTNNDNFLMNNVPSPSNEISSGLVSGVTLSEVPPPSGISYLPVSSDFSAICPSAAISEIQSCPGVVTDMVATAHLPDMSVLAGVQEEPIATHCQSDIGMPDFTQMQGMVPESNVVGIPGIDVMGPDTGNGGYMDPTSLQLENDKFSPESQMDSWVDGIKLPGINDDFWEQFLTPSDLTEDNADEIDLSTPEHVVKEVQLGRENVWDKAQHMDLITDQMGLLTSETTGG